MAGALVLDRLGSSDPATVSTGGKAPDVCFALAVIRETVLRERVTPPDATPEQQAATSEMNAELEQMREALFTLNGIRQMNCPRGG